MDNPPEIFGVKGGNVLKLAHDNLERKCSLILCLKRMFASAKLINKTAKRPNVSFFIVRFFLTQLRRQVIRSTNNCVGKFCTEGLCSAKISNSDIEVVVEKNVESLDIAV